MHTANRKANLTPPPDKVPVLTINLKVRVSVQSSPEVDVQDARVSGAGRPYQSRVLLQRHGSVNLAGVGIPDPVAPGLLERRRD